MMKNKKPVIRFKGFSEEWEEKKLGEVATETYGGGTPKTTEESYWNGNIPWFQSSDLTESKILDITQRKHISDEGLKTSATKLIPPNSIAIITRVGVGKLALLPFAYATSQDFLSLSNLNIDEKFGVYAIYKKIQGELNAVQGTSIKGITKNELLSKSFSVPKHQDEQTQIGNFFKNLDNLITLHQRKYEKLGVLKKAMLEKMFPKNGANVPEIRFKGFERAWEERMVGELYDFKNGLNKGKEFFGYGVPIVNFTDVFHNRGIESEKLKGRVSLTNTEIVNFKVQQGDIFFTRTSETIDEIGRPAVMVDAPPNTVFSGFVLRARAIGEDAMTINFKRYVFFTEAFRKEMVNKSSMTTRALTSGTAIKQMKVVFPINKEEQAKIGTYFKNLDDLLRLHEKELEKLKNLKKALLEKMFV